MKKGKGRNNGLLPNSLRIISSCLKTVSTNASNVASSVRSAGASVAASISTAEDHKDQVTWAGFDRLEVGPSTTKHVLLLGYQNGFQVFDVEDASNFTELVSKRDGPVSFLQMQPLPANSDDREGFGKSHPLLLVVAGDDTNSSSFGQNCTLSGGLERDGKAESHSGIFSSSPTAVRFYSLRSHGYVHVLRFRSSVCMVRCSSRIVAVGLATQIYCFDASTLENKFSVLTYPVPQLVGQGTAGVNVGYGPMAVAPRWLAYASKSPLLSNTGRLSPQNPISSPGVSPSTSPGGSSLMARYAMESGKHLAAGLINLGDMGCKTLSKYCQELLPDGSNSPVSPNSIWKVGGLAGSEAENAGTVVVKDFVSGAVISQFKAHTSPISALCFDPSGTLLVTASISGKNINIFRIMPSHTCGGSAAQNLDWRSSHVHLYKLHRGITSAIIQDICFSHYSQWIAIISSKGTCHIFVLSPFGGDAGFQTVNSQGEEPALYPVLSPPWWSTSSLFINQQSSPPPPAFSLSVVSRIKYSSFGWLNTVNNAANATTGKVFVPSGAVAAIFHNSVTHSPQPVNSRTKSLEHLLVYTPSGHVVQHELLPSVLVEPSENGAIFRAASPVHVQEDDLRVKVEPIQWWDVCRRSDWPEREERLSETSSDRRKLSEITPNNISCCEDDSCQVELLDTSDNIDGTRTLKTCPVKPHERSHWYLSNAELQVSSGRLPIWQNSKISFYVMGSPRDSHTTCGESDIEKMPTHKVEIKLKELLPVFDHFHSIKATWGDRFFTVGKYSQSAALESQQAGGRIIQETIICHSKPASLSSTESSEGGSSRRMEHLLDLDHIDNDKAFSPAHPAANGLFHGTKGNNINEFYMLNQKPATVTFCPSEETKIQKCISNGPIAQSIIDGICNVSVSDNYNDTHAKSHDGEPALPEAQTQVDFGLALREEYCKAVDRAEHKKSNEAVNGDLDSSSSHYEKEKAEDNRESDEMLGGIFGFAED